MSKSVEEKAHEWIDNNAVFKQDGDSMQIDLTSVYVAGHAECAREKDAEIERLKDLEGKQSQEWFKKWDKLINEIEPLKMKLAEARADSELKNVFIKKAARALSGARTATDFLANRKPGNSTMNIHETNVEYFKKLDKELELLDEDLFRLGNFENGEFILNSMKEGI